MGSSSEINHGSRDGSRDGSRRLFIPTTALLPLCARTVDFGARTSPLVDTVQARAASTASG